MEMMTKLTLDNCTLDDNQINIMPDMSGRDLNLIGFTITVDGDKIPLSAKELDADDGSETYFHINKAQAKVLISYLQSLVDDMQYYTQ